MVRSIEKLGELLDRFLPLALVALCGLAYAWPVESGTDPFVATVPYQPYMFMAAMFAIGTLLPRDELAQTLRQWPSVVFGTCVQYGAMPLLAYGMAHAASLSDEFRIGVVVTGCVPGAMASNVVTLIARGNVSYSVSLTTMATLLSPLIVPIAFYNLLGESVQVDAGKTALTLLWQVVLPVIAGHLASRSSARFAGLMSRIGPALAHLVILWIIAVVVALNRQRLPSTPAVLLFILLGENLLGYTAGYLGGRLARMDVARTRALTIEVGMQNAGLGTVLALQLFPDRPQILVPTALYTFGCVLTGSILAAVWSRLPVTSRRLD